MASEKVIERISKLLRLAAPSSGTTIAERSTAALEAARLIDEHGIAIAEPKDTSKNRVGRGIWVLSVALQHHGCQACNQLIAKGDVIWFRMIEKEGRCEYRHNAGTCRVVT